MADINPVVQAARDERLKEAGLLTKLMRRPELGAFMGVVIVTVFFVAVANPVMFELAGIMNFMAPAAQLGILAIGAALLMVGGEFDLSVGSMVAFTGLIFAACVVTLGISLPLAILLTLAFAAAMGFANGQIVIHTGLPSFIVTLAFLFILRGLSLVGLKWATGGATQLRGVREAATDSPLESFFYEIFAGDAFEGLFTWLAANDWIAKFPNGQPKVTGVPIEILWFVAVSGLAAFLLTRTRYGNWIFASGGDANAARNSGVPVRRVKTSLFMLTAVCAAIVAVLTVLDSGSTDARRGFQKEFEAIIAAVIGGCLLTGGYGSAIGAALGAVIFGMVLIGLTYTTIDQDWYLVFLGAMLLMAVFFNNIIRKRVTGER
ncbi:ABC transporter permease [Pseudaminobacter sp. NGMCC 1.201702]|uniref:ABC transporter permease n=1 Tax=Pseudaminobacter sp. NGMCC 1.201702 TaxID=3391825 RepID=UPI0039EE5178